MGVRPCLVSTVVLRGFEPCRFPCANARWSREKQTHAQIERERTKKERERERDIEREREKERLARAFLALIFQRNVFLVC